MKIPTNQPRNNVPLYADYMPGTSWVAGTLFAYDELAWSLHDAVAGWLPHQPQPIQAVFGGLPSCRWHAGRIAPKDVAPEHLGSLLGVIEEYNRRAIAVRFTWTYWDVTRADLGDKVGNTLLELAVESGRRHGIRNGVILTSDLLADYARRRYPELTQSASTIKAVRENPNWEDSPAYYNRLAERFDIVIPRPARNFDDEFLAALEPKPHMEILVNNICRMWCDEELHHMGLQKAVELRGMAQAPAALSHEDWCLERIRANPSHTVTCTAQDVRRIKNLGFSHFKIAGRECSINRMAWFLSMYLFEPGGLQVPLMPLFSRPVPGLPIKENSHVPS